MGPGKFAEIKRIRPPTPHNPCLMTHHSNSVVTPTNNVTPNKRRRNRSKITNRGDKHKQFRGSKLPSIKNKCTNKSEKAIVHVTPDRPKVAVLSTKPPDEERQSRYNMRERVFKCARSSSKPKCENRREINYTNLNDGLDDEDVYSPPRQKQVERDQAPTHLRKD